MGCITFSNKVLKHQIYSCFLTNNIFLVFSIISACVTITPRKPNFANIIVFLAALQIVFKRKISVKLSHINGSKKPIAVFYSNKKTVINSVKMAIFDFFFFNQSQLLKLSCNTKTVIFFSIHILRFNILHNYYKFLFNIPRLRVSFITNNASPKMLKIFTSLFRLPF